MRRAPAPLPGGRAVRLLEVPEIGPGHWLVVSSVPARTYDEAALQRGLQQLEWVGARALAHEAVVEHFLSAPAVLPMQLFTLFTSDDRALQHIVGNRRRIARLLARIEGQVEWGLRVTVDRGATPPQNRGRNPPVTAGGASYLQRKRDLLETARLRVQRARADAARVYRAIARTVTAARRRPEVEEAAPGSRVVLEAAFLVPARRRRAFEAAVRRQVKPLERAGLTVSLTGPWPAYNFL